MDSPLSMFASKDVVAIDLSGHHLKIAHAKISNIKREIVRLIDHDTKGMSDAEITGLVEEYVSELKAKNPAVICPIPNQITMTKNIEVPSRDIREVEEIINLQAGRHTPFAREEIVVDHVNLGVHKQTYTKILLIIVNRNVIMRQLNILSAAHLRVERMVFCPEAFASIYPSILKMSASDSPIVFAYIDDEYTDFTVVLKNMPLFVRSMPIGAEHFLSDKEVSENKFIEQIRLSMDAYQSENIGSVPTNLYLLGATEEVRDLEKKLNATLHVPARIVPYFSHLPMSDKAVSTLIEGAKRMSFLNVVAPLLAPDAMTVNLLPEEVKFKHKLEQRSRSMIKSGVYVIIIMTLLCSVLIGKIYFRSVYAKRIQQQLNAISGDVEMLEKAMTEVKLVKNYLSNQGYMLNVVSEIHDLLPDNTYLSDIKLSAGDVFSIRGFSDSMSSVFTFIGIMEGSSYFKNIEAKYTSKRKEKDRDVAIFEIVGELKKR